MAANRVSVVIADDQRLFAEALEAILSTDGRIDVVGRALDGRAAVELVREERPDVLVITPLIKLASRQPEFVKSAKALGIPVVYPVFSWDNLSTKGLVHVQPDAVLVWNDRQRTEAVEMHQVPDDRIVVTGASRFDEFFAMTPQTSRDEFCRLHQLDPVQPIVSYLCSSEFVAGHEFEFVQRWIGEIRRAPGGCARAAGRGSGRRACGGRTRCGIH